MTGHFTLAKDLRGRAGRELGSFGLYANDNQAEFLQTTSGDAALNSGQGAFPES